MCMEDAIEKRRGNSIARDLVKRTAERGLKCQRSDLRLCAPLYIRQLKQKNLTQKGGKNDKDYFSSYRSGSRRRNQCADQGSRIQAEMEGAV